MKKLAYLGFFATTLLSLAACQKEVDLQLAESGKNQVTFVFTAEKAGETKTAAIEGESSVSFKWTDEDENNIHLFLVSTVIEGEKEVEKLTEVEDIEINKESDTKLILTANVDEAESYTFRAMLFCETTSGGNPKMKSEQRPVGVNNYDPNADILISRDLTTTSPSDLLLTFDRQVVVNKMTVKGLTAGEKVDRVVVSSNKPLSGYYSNGKMTGQGSEITLNYSKEEIPASGEFPIYFVTMPNTGHTLSVAVYTENNVYTKSFGAGALDFTLGSFTRIGVSGFTKQTITDLSGTYVLTDASGSFMAIAYDDGNNIRSSQTTLENGTIYYNPDVILIDAAKVTLASTTINGKNLYTIKQNGKYLYAAGGQGENYLKAAAEIPETNNEGYYWNVTNTDGNWSVVATRSSNSNTLQMNSTTKNFACYSSASQTAIALYANFASTPVITASNLSLPNGDAVSEARTMNIEFNSVTASVTASAFEDENLTTESTWLNMTVSEQVVQFTASENKTGDERKAYVKITASDNGGRTVSEVITVSQPSIGSTKKTDHLTYALIGVVGTTYKDWSGISAISDAVYAGNSSGASSSISIRSNNNNSGIVTTASGGYLKSITITFNSGATAGRVVQVYGKNAEYSAASDLYDNSKQGELLGTIVAGSSTVLQIEGNYTFFGLKSSNNAVLIDDVAIEWGSEPFPDDSGDDTGGSNQYVLVPSDVDNVTAYTDAVNSITAGDGSSWEMTGYGATDDNIQLGKGGANYILTPNCEQGISSIVVTCSSSYYLAVATTGGEEIEAKQPSNGSITFDFSSDSPTQVKLIARRSSGNSNAAVYISKIVVNYN